MNMEGQYNPKDVERIPVENIEVLPSGADWQSRHLESERRKAEIRDRIHVELLYHPILQVVILRKNNRKSSTAMHWRDDNDVHIEQSSGEIAERGMPT